MDFSLFFWLWCRGRFLVYPAFWKLCLAFFCDRKDHPSVISPTDDMVVGGVVVCRCGGGGGGHGGNVIMFHAHATHGPVLVQVSQLTSPFVPSSPDAALQRYLVCFTLVPGTWYLVSYRCC